MHWAEFGEEEVCTLHPAAYVSVSHLMSLTLPVPQQSAQLLAAIKEYDANKWKVIGQKLGKPAKVCDRNHNFLVTVTRSSNGGL